MTGTDNADGTCRDCGERVWWHDDRLVTRGGRKWCFGPDGKRVDMTHWHALPDMAQYIVPSPEGKVCRCLAKGYSHVHLIVRVPEETSSVNPPAPGQDPIERGLWQLNDVRLPAGYEVRCRCGRELSNSLFCVDCGRIPSYCECEPT